MRHTCTGVHVRYTCSKKVVLVSYIRKKKIQILTIIMLHLHAHARMSVLQSHVKNTFCLYFVQLLFKKCAQLHVTTCRTRFYRALLLEYALRHPPLLHITYALSNYETPVLRRG